MRDEATQTPCPTCGRRLYKETGPCAGEDNADALRYQWMAANPRDRASWEFCDSKAEMDARIDERMRRGRESMLKDEAAIVIKIQCPAKLIEAVTPWKTIKLPRPVTMKPGVAYLALARGNKAVVVRDTPRNRKRFENGTLP